APPPLSGHEPIFAQWLAAGPAAPADERLAAWLSLDHAGEVAQHLAARGGGGTPGFRGRLLRLVPRQAMFADAQGRAAVILRRGAATWESEVPSAARLRPCPLVPGSRHRC